MARAAGGRDSLSLSLCVCVCTAVSRAAAARRRGCADAQGHSACRQCRKIRSEELEEAEKEAEKERRRKGAAEAAAMDGSPAPGQALVAAAATAAGSAAAEAAASAVPATIGGLCTERARPADFETCVKNARFLFTRIFGAEVGLFCAVRACTATPCCEPDAAARARGAAYRACIGGGRAAVAAC